jgi:hypothetical protein
MKAVMSMDFCNWLRASGIAMLLLTSCSENPFSRSNHDPAPVKNAIYNQLNSSQQAAARVWREFLSIFPSAKRSIGLNWNEQIQRFTGNATASTVLEQRCVLKVIVDFSTTSDLKDVTFRPVRFNFYEIEEVNPVVGGGASIILNTTNQAWFGEQGWTDLVADGWRFEKLGISVRSNLPVANIGLLTNP